MSPPTVTIHGAGRTVTGSCYEVACGDARILVDCGLFQGSRTLETLNHTAASFDAKAIDAVILTHAHLDHSGLLPKLVANGFSGPIWTTAPTADLLVPMLADAARLQEQETMRRNRRHDRAGDPPIQAIYTMADANAALDLIQTQPQETPFTAAPGFEAVLWNAGHILGSSSVELRCGGSRLLFSGDLGPAHKAFEPDPVGPAGLDHVFCESTYGDRERETVTIANASHRAFGRAGQCRSYSRACGPPLGLFHRAVTSIVTAASRQAQHIAWQLRAWASLKLANDQRSPRSLLLGLVAG